MYSWKCHGCGEEVRHGLTHSCVLTFPVTPKLTGGSSDYYVVDVKNPTRNSEPYTAECNDIIEALGMNFAEGNIFKAIWRSCAARRGNGKPGSSALYDAEKIVFFGKRLLVAAGGKIEPVSKPPSRPYDAKGHAAALPSL